MLVEITEKNGDNGILNIDNILYVMPEKNGTTYVNFGNAIHFYQLDYESFKRQIDEALRGVKYVD